jgi:hypothetical protein
VPKSEEKKKESVEDSVKDAWDAESSEEEPEPVKPEPEPVTPVKEKKSPEHKTKEVISIDFIMNRSNNFHLGTSMRLELLKYCLLKYWGTGLPYRLHIRKTDHNLLRGWVLTNAKSAGTNNFTMPSEHGGAQDYKFLGTHPISNLCDCCLSSASHAASQHSIKQIRFSLSVPLYV